MVEFAAVARACEAEPVGRSVHGLGDVQITDATHDSRQVEPGWLYCCVPGETVDGHGFAGDAVDKGAAALLVERELDLPVPQMLVPSVRSAMGVAAAEVHQHPSRELRILGVTGTNGKSSIVQLLADIYRQAGHNTAVVGTLTHARTTPEATDLQRLLAQALQNGTEVVAVEVSSHALDMGRVNGTHFTSAVFTNLGHDHLDYHHTVERYFAAKSRLFVGGFTERAVINVDDAYGRRLAEMVNGEVHTYSLVDIQGLRFDGPTSTFVWRDRTVVLPLAGIHNVSNAVGAAVCAEANGVGIDDIVSGLEATSPVRGRFEMVAGSQPFHVAVDYAHTPDAMEAALIAARQVAGANRVVIVFGCGGDRDAQKRPEMGQVAEKGADVVIVTSDNPRSENPAVIVEAILSGVCDRSSVVVEPDRAKAIGAAIGQAGPGDVVLIAGKGHETEQIIGGTTLEFDDVAVARTLLEALA